MGTQKFWRRGWLVSLQVQLFPQKYASPYLCYSAKFCHSKLNCTSVIKEICHQILPLINNLSLSLKVIGTHEYRSAILRLGNNGPISYREKSDTCMGGANGGCGWSMSTHFWDQRCTWGTEGRSYEKWFLLLQQTVFIQYCTSDWISTPLALLDWHLTS